ncbi:FAD-dependent oxidoreductase [Microbacterium sp.]|uniref:FAD-dependent oxidoreductase n=1 Tax=Microbacterium sp. TaxID=51671 RepID=UPI003A84BB74
MADATTDGWDRTVDLLVLGTGASGLSAAVTAASGGLDVLVLETTEYLGGTTAYSAGTAWIPGNHPPESDEDRATAQRYLDELVGDRAPRILRETYLARGPETLEFYRRLGLRFLHSASVVDYHPERPGAGVGRAWEPEPFDGRRLGREKFRRVRPPVPEFALFGGTLMVRRVEVTRLLDLFRGSPGAAALALRLGARWARDRLTWPRGTRLTMGNALVAHLYHLLTRAGGRVAFSATTTELIASRGTVTGAIVGIGGRDLRIRARHGVVLAGGGFPAGEQWRRRHLPTPTAHATRAADGSTGSTLELGLAVGGVLGPDHEDNALWFPASLGRRRDGSRVVFPHIWDRAKPGIVAVAESGRRFVDESVSYHRFVRAMYAATAAGETAIPAWLILDSATLRAHGLGMIRPHTPGPALRRYVRDGYIRRARTLTALAEQIGVDSGGLHDTVVRANRSAITGIDVEFGKGTSPFGRQYGDPRHGPNPNLGPIATPPFYALPVVPTPLATARGLRTDADARVHDGHGQPVPGLYAVGNDADSPMAAEYPGAGCQVGAGLIFGHLAGLDAARGAAATTEG